MDIIELLKNKGKLNVTEICKELDQEQSKISHNLKKLQLCNVVKVKQEKNYRFYELNEKTIIPLLDLIDKHSTCSCETCRLLKHKNEKCSHWKNSWRYN